MPRTSFSDLGFQPKRLRIVLTVKEWQILEDEADRQRRGLASVVSTLLGLTVANRPSAETLIRQVRDESDARFGGVPRL